MSRAMERPFDLAQGRVCKPRFVERAPESKANAEPSTEEGIEPVRLLRLRSGPVYASPFQAHLSIDRVSSVHRE